jgi:spermidine/putrescine transport system permease protein
MKMEIMDSKTKTGKYLEKNHPDPLGEKAKKTDRALYLLLGPAMAWLIFFMFLPLLIMLIFSFGTMTGGSMSLSTKYTLHNYLRMTQSFLYLKVLWNSFKLAAIVVGICLLMGYPTAYLLATRSHLAKFVLLCLMLVPFWTSVLLRSYAWMLMLQDSGAVNSLLMGFYLIKSPLHILWTEGAVVLACVQIYLPFMVIPLYAVLEIHNWKLVEAAKNLGANKARAFWEITLPLSVPGLIVGTLFVFVPMMGEFLIPSMLGGTSFPVTSQVIESNFGITFNWPLGCAVAIILSALICAVVFLFLRIAPPWKLLEKRV